MKRLKSLLWILVRHYCFLLIQIVVNVFNIFDCSPKCIFCTWSPKLERYYLSELVYCFWCYITSANSRINISIFLFEQKDHSSSMYFNLKTLCPINTKLETVWEVSVNNWGVKILLQATYFHYKCIIKHCSYGDKCR
jgi:hypothetical protein